LIEGKGRRKKTNEMNRLQMAVETKSL